jgi:hypothetical protein
MKAAVIRGTYTAIGTFAATFLATLATGVPLRTALIAAGIVALASLGFRAGVEGHYDTTRALHAALGVAGAVHASDVGSGVVLPTLVAHAIQSGETLTPLTPAPPAPPA